MNVFQYTANGYIEIIFILFRLISQQVITEGTSDKNRWILCQTFQGRHEIAMSNNPVGKFFVVARNEVVLTEGRNLDRRASLRCQSTRD